MTQTLVSLLVAMEAVHLNAGGRALLQGIASASAPGPWLQNSPLQLPLYSKFWHHQGPLAHRSCSMLRHYQLLLQGVSLRWYLTALTLLSSKNSCGT